VIELPIDPHVPAIAETLRRTRAIVVVAAPGAGKTTRVPPALAADGPVILLQPRRVAARSIAERIARERDWTLGEEVGWHIRFERHFGPRTRLLVATEGILTARLQQDPLLSAFQTVVLDEFHERSIHADLGLALSKQAWLARDDLRVVVMSATLDAEPVARFFGDCPIVSVPGRTFPIDVSYASEQSPAQAASEIAAATGGDVLCFLPGAFEIQRTISELRGRVADDVNVLPLYGALDSAEQDRAVHGGSCRRIVVATNIAETSITVPGVTAVVDAGLQKVARYDANRGLDTLITERITQDSADQRAGRAGRTAPGIVRRLWAARDRLRPHREPEIHRVDLSSSVLDVVAWGGDPRTFEWFEAPRPDTIDAALRLLERLGAIQGGIITPLGRTMRQLPLHPRLARILVAGNGGRPYAQACALLSERSFLPPRSASTTSDLLSAIDDWNEVPAHIVRVARDVEQLAGRILSTTSGAIPRAEAEFRRALFVGYPDRVAQRRDRASARVRLASGAGAIVAPESGVRDGEFLIAIDVQGSTRAAEPDSRIRTASRVEREWLEPTAVETVHRIDDAGRVRAFDIERYDALVLAEHSRPVDAEIACELLASAYLERPLPNGDAELLRRLRFAGLTVNLHELIRHAARGKRSLADVDVYGALPRDTVLAVTRDAPDQIIAPSGRAVRLEYAEDGSVTAAVKLQELFGLAETPRIGPDREPVLLSLLAPNGRPVQLTRDLRSFWDRTYPEVRKELRGRYPRHPWPADPWNATPTARTTRKMRD
jgi:ATP-dependent helicase HrpB